MTSGRALLDISLPIVSFQIRLTHLANDSIYNDSIEIINDKAH